MQGKPSLQDKLLAVIVNHIGKDFWLALKDNIPAAYQKASKLSSDNFKSIPKSRVLPQLRRYSLDNALVDICSSVEPELRWADHNGEHYVQFTSGRITISYAAINSGDSKPRNAKHRQQMAHKNLTFDHFQVDWVDKPEASFDDKQALHVVVIVTNPKKDCDDQDSPAEIRVVVPYSNWSAYHFDKTLTDIIRSYDQQQVDLFDGAWTTLREDLMENERKEE